MPRLPAHTLFVTYLHDAASQRRASLEHLADLMAPIPEREVRSWFDGTASPSISELSTLASALKVDLAELVVGWMIDRAPDIEARVRPFTLDAMGSSFPRADDLALRSPRFQADMKVPDPFDDHSSAGGEVRPAHGAIRKRASNIGGKRAEDHQTSPVDSGK